MRKLNHTSALQTRTFKTGTFAIVLLTGLFLSVAHASEAQAVIDNLSGFLFGIVKAIGIIMLLLGMVQLGLSLKSHDPSQRANSFLTITGGLVVAFSEQILKFIGAM